MRDFARPDVLAQAAGAAVLGTAACLPRLLLWTSTPGAVWVLATVLGWCIFVLWCFVFAWSDLHGGVRPFATSSKPSFWLKMTAATIGGAVLLALLVDPGYRRLFPAESPGNLRQWTAGLLFNLSLQQLFFCFAPYAFFSRLGAGPQTALGLTVGLSLAVLTMKINRAPFEPSAIGIVVMVAARGSLAAVGVLLYRRAGMPAVWWLALVLQCRHLPRLFTTE
jgi:hypothetical protein